MDGDGEVINVAKGLSTWLIAKGRNRQNGEDVGGLIKPD